MLLPGHIAAGYLVGRAVILLSHDALSTAQQNTALLAATIAAVAPDLDLLYFFAKNRSARLKDDESHRSLVSHAPLLWLVLGGLVAALGGSAFSLSFGAAIWLGSWSHFLGDSIEYGVMWLWPFSGKRYSLRSISENGPESNTLHGFYFKYFWHIYARNRTFWLEIAVITGALAAFFWK